MSMALGALRFRLGRFERLGKYSRGPVGVAGTALLLPGRMANRSLLPEIDKRDGSGGKKLSWGVCGDPPSFGPLREATGERVSNLARGDLGEWKIAARVFRESGVGEVKFFNSRPFVKEEASFGTVSEDFGLRFADGKSSITLSLSPSLLSGDAWIGDNLLLENLGAFPEAEALKLVHFPSMFRGEDDTRACLW